jgi:hypothetical protein
MDTTPVVTNNMELTFQVTPNSPQMDVAPVVTSDIEQNHVVNSAVACQLPEIAILCKCSYPFSGDVPRKKQKKENYMTEGLQAMKGFRAYRRS